MQPSSKPNSTTPPPSLRLRLAATVMAEGDALDASVQFGGILRADIACTLAPGELITVSGLAGSMVPCPITDSFRKWRRSEDVRARGSSITFPASVSTPPTSPS